VSSLYITEDFYLFTQPERAGIWKRGRAISLSVYLASTVQYFDRSILVLVIAASDLLLYVQLNSLLLSSA